jgi:hypothetical protein
MRKVRLEDSLDRMKIRQAEVNDRAVFDPDLHDVSMLGGEWHIVPKPKRTVDDQMRQRSDRVIRTLVDINMANEKFWKDRNEE